ncbi:hypothetical protein A2Z33_03245 [Candidatus Gottesmanbacteria bacterium RBG_16_52_11]|uniref:AB hydrolase-1 domain-containing protein n=1 Tax=Candidatus Gottesmanbacteria bacterium RBG_16_52_11 TaxID=1798374 RepID=A0A1F5YVB8_9BACT|nr:MAG: hypothetical protein A2Z33_03245 [Candidatus Gottesmanbacteria bacterium RBG_16_52_11]
MAKKKKAVGSLTRVVILHGWAYRTGRWQVFCRILTDSGFDPVLLPLPGLTAPTDKAWTVPEYMAWLDRRIAAMPGTVIMVGHSNGGRLAMWYTLTHPDRIGHLVLIDSAGIRHNDPLSVLKRAVFKFLAKTGKRLTRSEKLKRLLYILAREKDYYDAPGHTKITMRNLLSADAGLSPGQISVPATIIWGRMDRITPLADGEALHRLIPHSQLRVINDAGHAPQFTHPQEVAAIIGRLFS